jgi:hypothetical protein
MTNVKLGTVDLKTGVAPIIGFWPNKKPGVYIPGTEGGRTSHDKLVTIEFDGGGKLLSYLSIHGQKRRIVKGL